MASPVNQVVDKIKPSDGLLENLIANVKNITESMGFVHFSSGKETFWIKNIDRSSSDLDSDVVYYHFGLILGRRIVPPTVKKTGDTYFIDAGLGSATGAWVGQEDKEATWDEDADAWSFRTVVSASESGYCFIDHGESSDYEGLFNIIYLITTSSETAKIKYEAL